MAAPEVVSRLQELLQDRCITQPETLQVYGKDYSYHGSGTPNVVVFPVSTEEIVQIVKLCGTHSTPLITYGSGTSLEGHITAVQGGVCMSLQKMDQVLRLNEKDMDVIVQPGVTFPRLNDYLKPHNLYFPLDAGPQASIGGMVATSASGTKAVRYGTMKENVIALKVVLPDGKVVKTANRARKTVSGYDLTHLFVGSEGTLGVVTEITLKVHNIPKHRAATLVHFDTIEQAANATMDMMQNEDTKCLTMVELLDDLMMKAINLRYGLTYRELPTLYFEFGGEAEKTLLGQEEIVRRVCTKYGGGNLLFATSEAEREQLWKVRKSALFASTALRSKEEKAGKEIAVWTTDVAVPISRLADCIRETHEDLKGSFLLAPLVGHVGDGNFHLFILLDPLDPKELQEAKRINSRLVARAIAMEGTCTGEHGVGIGKLDYVETELGKEAVDLMRTIKHAVDPKNIMNPGKKVIGTPTSTENTRLGDGQQVSPIGEIGIEAGGVGAKVTVEVPTPKSFKMSVAWGAGVMDLDRPHVAKL